jgi:hypothetical protein
MVGWLNQAHANIRNSFPASTTQMMIAEFGADYDGGQGLQQAVDNAALIAWAEQTKDIAGLLHWQMYDDLPSFSTHKLGMAPLAGIASGTRNTYMVLGTLRGALFDGDFENGLDGWTTSGLGTQASTITNGGVTGNGYGHMLVTAAGQSSFCSPGFVLPDGPSVATGGFLRTGLANVTLVTNYFDSNGSFLTQDSISLQQSAVGVWNQIQEQSLSKRATVGSGAAAAQVCFVIDAPSGTSATNPQSLDLDSITSYDY